MQQAVAARRYAFQASTGFGAAGSNLRYLRIRHNTHPGGRSDKSLSNISQQELMQVQQLLQQGRFADAATACRALLKRAPKAPQLSQMLAVALQRTGDMDGADRAYKDALEGAPNAVPLLLDYGRFLRAAGRPAQAERRYRKALKLDPKSVPGWRSLGLLLRADGQLGEAERCARRATELGPGDPGRGYGILARSTGWVAAATRER